MLIFRGQMTIEPTTNLDHCSLLVVFSSQIGHAIRGCDVPSLFRDFGIVIINVVDTQVRLSVLLWLFAKTRRVILLAR